MSEFTHTVSHAPQVRAVDNKVFTSMGGQAHTGKKCKPVCALTPEHKTLGSHWNREIGQTVVALEDGTEIAVLNDEVRG